MLRLKRLDVYVLKNFLTLFFATFFICSLILIMQFFWMHIGDLVGKGLPTKVLLQFFFYTWMTLVPLALPLAILLASLMTFGDMGEKLELLAMKTAGISLFRIMRSLILFISIMCIGAFFFSNDVVPVAQKRLWTLLFSFRQKSPELNIPTGEFYAGISDMRIYVREKNHDSGALINVMIYDFSKGFDKASVTTADTMFVKMTADKKNLQLTLINGESFENMNDKNKQYASQNVPYRRESFRQRVMLLDFNGDFKAMDESLLDDQYVSKNFARLGHDIDSISVYRDSLRNSLISDMLDNRYFGKAFVVDTANANKLEQEKRRGIRDSLIVSYNYNTDSLFYNATRIQMLTIIRSVKSKISSMKSDIQYNRAVSNTAKDFYVRHSIEWHRKLTLSFACLIFFFIGAPLGAIIRKGGLGMPVVTSVLMFIVYYIIDTTGLKMAREIIWPVWQGMWLSSAVLLPVGIFLTYKAANDSALFNADDYKLFFERFKLRIIHLKDSLRIKITKIYK